MSKQSFSATGLLIGGFVFFALGLLLILQQNPVSGLFTQITPNIQTIEAAGVIIQFIGQALVVLGVMKSTSHKLISSMQAERQMTMSNITQNMQQIHAEQQALKTGVVQTMAKLDTLITNQSAATILPKALMPSNCKFCGTRIEQGYFCPQCGKAN